MRFRLRTDDRLDAADVTEHVAGAAPNDADTGTVTVSVEHTTAGIVVDETEPNLLAGQRPPSPVRPRSEGRPGSRPIGRKRGHIPGRSRSGRQ